MYRSTRGQTYRIRLKSSFATAKYAYENQKTGRAFFMENSSFMSIFQRVTLNLKNTILPINFALI